MNQLNGQRNVCSYKQACIGCNLVDPSDRPDMCVKLECEFYTPCASCKKNKTIDGNKLCKICNNKAAAFESEIEQEAKDKKFVPSHTTPNTNRHHKESSEERLRTLVYSVTPPGTPPPELKDDERQYYIQRWTEYKGYYRNPAAHFICHTMILEEIHLSFISASAISSRGEKSFEYDRLKKQSIDTLAILKKQLPEKESEETSDYEQSMAVVYDRYIEELSKDRKLSKVHRILSDEAIALAPSLNIKLDPVELLKQCGYTLQTAEEVAAKYINMNDIEEFKDPNKVLEFFGFKLREKYAMPFDVSEEESGVDEFQVIDID